MLKHDKLPLGLFYFRSGFLFACKIERPSGKLGPFAVMASA